MKSFKQKKRDATICSQHNIFFSKHIGNQMTNYLNISINFADTLHIVHIFFFFRRIYLHVCGKMIKRVWVLITRCMHINCLNMWPPKLSVLLKIYTHRHTCWERGREANRYAQTISYFLVWLYFVRCCCCWHVSFELCAKNHKKAKHTHIYTSIFLSLSEDVHLTAIYVEMRVRQLILWRVQTRYANTD